MKAIKYIGAILVGTLSVVLTIGSTTRVVDGKYRMEVRKTVSEVTVLAQKIAELPSLAQTVYIYSGTEYVMNPVYDSSKVNLSGTLSATAAGSYQLTFSLKDPTRMKWTDGTSENKTISWGINICRIGEVYYPSITTALSTDLSTSATPIVLLVDWSENAVNSSQYDYLDLNGKTLTGNITNTSSGGLSVGNGTVTNRQSSSQVVCALKNTAGTLDVKSGTYITENTGANEANSIVVTGGTVNITGSTIEAYSSEYAAVGVWTSGGQTTVSNCSFKSVCRNATATPHNAFISYASGGTLNVESSTGTCTGENKGTVCFFGVSSGTVNLKGGTFSGSSASGTTNGCVECFGGNVAITGGSYTINDNATGISHCVLVHGGTVQMSGGTCSVTTPAQITNVLTEQNGSFIMTGGSLQGTTTSTSTATGVQFSNTTGGQIAISGSADMSIVGKGSVLGFVKGGYYGTSTSVSDTSFRITGGTFLMRGKSVMAMHAVTSTYPWIQTLGGSYQAYYQASGGSASKGDHFSNDFSLSVTKVKGLMAIPPMDMMMDPDETEAELPTDREEAEVTQRVNAEEESEEVDVNEVGPESEEQDSDDMESRSETDESVAENPDEESSVETPLDPSAESDEESSDQDTEGKNPPLQEETGEKENS